MYVSKASRWNLKRWAYSIEVIISFCTKCVIVAVYSIFISLRLLAVCDIYYLVGLSKSSDTLLFMPLRKSWGA